MVVAVVIAPTALQVGAGALEVIAESFIDVSSVTQALIVVGNWAVLVVRKRLMERQVAHLLG